MSLVGQATQEQFKIISTTLKWPTEEVLYTQQHKTHAKSNFSEQIVLGDNNRSVYTVCMAMKMRIGVENVDCDSHCMHLTHWP